MNKKEQAMHMYMNESCTQQHIATTLGISIRTLYSWIRQNSWDRLKQASLAAPVIIADNMCFQLLAMQQAIAEREPGQQFPTMQEAEITRKLVMCIDKLKRYPSLTQSMQVLETFRQYVREGSERDSWPIERWMGNFMASKAKGGFRPNDIEYNAESLSPFGIPFEEEEDIDDTTTDTAGKTDTGDFSDQPEILPETDTYIIDNQSIEEVDSNCTSRQQSEVNPAIQQTSFANSLPTNFKDTEPPIHNSSFITHNATTDFTLEELVDNLTAENFKNENVSPETVAAYRQSLMLVMKGNLEDNEDDELHPEVRHQNTTLKGDNQFIIPTSDSPVNRQQSEVLASVCPVRLRAS